MIVTYSCALQGEPNNVFRNKKHPSNDCQKIVMQSQLMWRTACRLPSCIITEMMVLFRRFQFSCFPVFQRIREHISGGIWQPCVLGPQRCKCMSNFARLSAAIFCCTSLICFLFLEINLNTLYINSSTWHISFRAWITKVMMIKVV